MRDRRRTTAIVLAGGVALAGAGFAIGSQSGDGSAEAARGGNRTADSRPAHFGGRGGPGGPHRRFGSLADDLGVSEEKLREALESLRPSGDRDDKHAELAAALARSLGVDEAKVTDALEGLHDARHGDRAAALARRLGVSRAKLRAAMREMGPPGPGRHGRHGPGGRGGHDIADELADALGVEASEVEEALQAFHDAKRDEFAQKLADALGIDVEKVREALPDHP